MKRKAALMMALVIAAVNLCACGSKSGETETAPAKEETSAPADSDEVITFKMNINDNETSNYYKGALALADEVREATQGRIEIEVYGSGSLGDEPECLEMCQSGDLDIATIASSKMVSFIPEMAILDQAYLFTTVDQAHAAIDGPVGELLAEAAYENLGVHYIASMESGFRNVFSTKPIASVEDFQGIKIRTMESDSHMLAFNSFGAVATPLAASEQITALQTGTIDACENAISNMIANGFYDYCPYVTWSNHAFVYINLFVSDNAWNQVPDDLKDAFTDALRRGCDIQRQYLQEANESAVEELTAMGITFFDIDTDELQQIYQEAAKEAGFTYDPVWQAALDEAISSVE